LGPIPIS